LEPDNAFYKIWTIVKPACLVSQDALMHSYQALQLIKSVPGSVAECGVFRGGSLRLFAEVFPEKTVWGFDTFTGIPLEMTNSGYDYHKAGDFSETSLEEVVAYLGYYKNINIVPGIFPGTFEQVPGDETFCCVHLDCDQFYSYIACLDFFMPRLEVGGIFIFDDYAYLDGAKMAIDQILPDLKKPPYIIKKVNHGLFRTIVTRDSGSIAWIEEQHAA